jgi:hypothetical protein
MLRLLLGIAAFFLVAPAAPAYIGTPITAGPLFIRVGVSDLIVIAKVEEVEQKPSLEENPFAQNRTKNLYVGTLAVSEVILGDRTLKSVKAAAPFYYVTINYDDLVKPQKHAPALKTFRKGREGLFFLQWSPVHKVYSVGLDPLFVEKTDPVYAAELERTRAYAKLLADPKASLRSDDVTARSTLLVYRYRWPRLCGNAEAPIDAEESKLILDGLAAAKWDIYPNDIRVILYNQCFNLIGGVLPKENVFADDEVARAKAWLAKNRETFRIKKWVWNGKRGER